MDFHDMKRKTLQALCKKHNLPAGGTNLELADKLTSLLKKPEVDPNPQKGLKRHDRSRDEINTPSKKAKVDLEEQQQISTRQTRSRKGDLHDTLVVNEEPKNSSKPEEKSTRRSKRGTSTVVEKSDVSVEEAVVLSDAKVQVVYEEKSSRRSKRNVASNEESVQLDGQPGTSEKPVRVTRLRRGAGEVALPASPVELKKPRKGADVESDGRGDKLELGTSVVAPSTVKKRVTRRGAKEEISDGDKRGSKGPDDGGDKKEVRVRSRVGAEDTVVHPSPVEKRRTRRAATEEIDDGGDKEEVRTRSQVGAEETVVHPSPVEKRRTRRAANEEIDDGVKKATEVRNDVSDDGGSKKEVETRSQVGAEATVVHPSPVEKRRTRRGANEETDDGVNKATEVRNVSDDAGSKKEVVTRSRLGAEATAVHLSPVEKRRTRRGANEETETGDKKSNDVRDVSDDTGNKKELRARSHMDAEAIFVSPSPIGKRKARSTATKENSAQTGPLRNRKVVTTEVEVQLKKKDTSPRKTGRESEKRKSNKDVGDVLNKSTKQTLSRYKTTELDNGPGTSTSGLGSGDVEYVEVQAEVDLEPVEKAPSRSKKNTSSNEKDSLKEKVASPKNKVKLVNEQPKSVSKPETASRRSTRIASTDVGSALSDRQARTDTVIEKKSLFEAEDVAASDKQVARRSRRTTSTISESIKSEDIGNQNPGQVTPKVDQSPRMSQSSASKRKSVELPGRSTRSALRSESIASDSRLAGSPESIPPNVLAGETTVLPEDGSAVQNKATAKKSSGKGRLGKSAKKQSKTTHNPEEVEDVDAELVPKAMDKSVSEEREIVPSQNASLLVDAQDTAGHPLVTGAENVHRRNGTSDELNAEAVSNAGAPKTATDSSPGTTVLASTVSENDPSNNDLDHTEVQKVQADLINAVDTVSSSLAEEISPSVMDMETRDEEAVPFTEDSSQVSVGKTSLDCNLRSADEQVQLEENFCNESEVHAGDQASTLKDETRDPEGLVIGTLTSPAPQGGMEYEENVSKLEKPRGPIKMLETSSEFKDGGIGSEDGNRSPISKADSPITLNVDKGVTELEGIREDDTETSPVTVDEEEEVLPFSEKKEGIEGQEAEDGRGRTSPISQAFVPSAVHINLVSVEDNPEVESPSNPEEERLRMVFEKKDAADAQEAQDREGRTSPISQACSPHTVDNSVPKTEDNREVDTPSNVEEEEKSQMVSEEKEGGEGQNEENRDGETLPILQAYDSNAANVEKNVAQVEDNCAVGTPSNLQEEEKLDQAVETKEIMDVQDAEDRNREASPVPQGIVDVELNVAELEDKFVDEEEKLAGVSDKIDSEEEQHTDFSQQVPEDLVNLEKNVDRETDGEENFELDTPNNVDEEQHTDLSQQVPEDLVNLEKNVDPETDGEVNCEVDTSNNVDEEEKLPGVSEKNDGMEEQLTDLLPEELVDLKTDVDQYTEGRVSAVSNELDTSDFKVDEDGLDDDVRVSPSTQACIPDNLRDEEAVTRVDVAIDVEIDADISEGVEIDTDISEGENPESSQQAQEEPVDRESGKVPEILGYSDFDLHIPVEESMVAVEEDAGALHLSDDYSPTDIENEESAANTGHIYDFAKNVDILVKEEDTNALKDSEGLVEFSKGDSSNVEPDQQFLQSDEMQDQEYASFDSLGGTVAAEDNKSFSSPINVEDAAAKEDDSEFEMNDDFVEEEGGVESPQQVPNKFVEFEMPEVVQVHVSSKIESDEHLPMSDEQLEGDTVNSSDRDDRTSAEYRVFPTSQAEVPEDFAKNHGHLPTENIFQFADAAVSGGSNMPQNAEHLGSPRYSPSYGPSNVEEETSVATSGKYIESEMFNMSAEDRLYTQDSEHVPEKQPVLEEDLVKSSTTVISELGESSLPFAITDVDESIRKALESTRKMMTQGGQASQVEFGTDVRIEREITIETSGVSLTKQEEEDDHKDDSDSKGKDVWSNYSEIYEFSSEGFFPSQELDHMDAGTQREIPIIGSDEGGEERKELNEMSYEFPGEEDIFTSQFTSQGMHDIIIGSGAHREIKLDTDEDVLNEEEMKKSDM